MKNRTKVKKEPFSKQNTAKVIKDLETTIRFCIDGRVSPDITNVLISLYRSLSEASLKNDYRGMAIFQYAVDECQKVFDKKEKKQY